jgi:hypothetical protein
MNVQLIPVIEIGYNNQDVKAPEAESYPYWDNSDIWDKYHKECYLKAGFKDDMKPYLKGSSFYKLTDLSHENLVKLTKDHTEELRTGKYSREEACAFFGGYVLHVDRQDKYFPQCCGELSDIIYWERLANGSLSYYEGHPAPEVKFKDDFIVLDFSDEEYETFQPPPADTILKIYRSSLREAVEKAKVELQDFAERLREINNQESLNIEDIERLLIWNATNYE